LDLVASEKLLTDVTTAAASAATDAASDVDGFGGNAFTLAESPSTEVEIALVPLGKSDLADLASDDASVLIVLT
jgi:hypothetical protein